MTKTNKNKFRQWLSVTFGFAIIAVGVWIVLVVGKNTVSLFSSLEPAVLAALITAAATALGAVTVVVLTRYYQSKHEEAAAHRDKKIELYNTVVSKLFEIFTGTEEFDEAENADTDLVSFLRETQKNLILWSGPKALVSYAEWHKVLTSGGEPRAITMIKMLDFFLALRADLGHSNKGLKHDHLVRLLVRSPDLFMLKYREDPNSTFEEISKVAKSMGLE